MVTNRAIYDPFCRIISENIELPKNYFPILIENSEDEGEEKKTTNDVKMLKIAPMLIKVCMYRVFIRYCVFLEDFKIFRTLAFLCFLSVSVCVHTPGR